MGIFPVHKTTPQVPLPKAKTMVVKGLSSAKWPSVGHEVPKATIPVVPKKRIPLFRGKGPSSVPKIDSIFDPFHDSQFRVEPRGSVKPEKRTIILRHTPPVIPTVEFFSDDVPRPRFPGSHHSSAGEFRAVMPGKKPITAKKTRAILRQANTIPIPNWKELEKKETVGDKTTRFFQVPNRRETVASSVLRRGTRLEWQLRGRKLINRENLYNLTRRIRKSMAERGFHQATGLHQKGDKLKLDQIQHRFWEYLNWHGQQNPKVISSSFIRDENGRVYFMSLHSYRVTMEKNEQGEVTKIHAANPKEEGHLRIYDVSELVHGWNNERYQHQFPFESMEESLRCSMDWNDQSDRISISSKTTVESQKTLRTFFERVTGLSWVKE